MAKSVFCIARTEAQATTIVDQLKAANFPTTISRSCCRTKPARGTLPTNSTPKRPKVRPREQARAAYWEAP